MKYTAIPRTPTRATDLDEEDLLPSRLAHRRPHRNLHNLVLYTLLGLLLLVNIFLVSSLHNLGLHLPANYSFSSASSSAASAPLYPFPNRTVFLPHPDYESFSPLQDKLWQKLQSPNGGFLVKVMEDGSRHNFGISMFHQLHCLQNLREGLQLLASLVNGTSTLEDAKKKADMVHFGHCVDYVRQGIICAADDTVEVPHYEVNSLDMISGHNIVHQCRDKDAVWRMSEDSGYVDPDMPFDIPDPEAQ